MNKFAEMARKATVLSPIFENRTKITTDDLIRSFPGGITITEFDLIRSDKGSYYAYAFAEDNTRFANAGAILSFCISGWVDAYDGDVSAASDALKAAGGCRVKLSKSTTNKGQPITRVEIVE